MQGEVLIAIILHAPMPAVNDQVLPFAPVVPAENPSEPQVEQLTILSKNWKQR